MRSVKGVLVGAFVGGPLIAMLTPGCEKVVVVRTWKSGFRYRIPIAVLNNSASALNGYQLKLIIDTRSLISAGKMRSDGGDIRFTREDEVTDIPYWVESGMNTPGTVIWVKVPYLLAGSTTKIYMYYGNPAASSLSNPSDVFLLFDDFQTNTTGIKWQVNTGTHLSDTSISCCASIAVGKALVGGYGWYSFVSKNFKVARPFIAEMKFQVDNVSGHTGFIQYYDPAISLDFNRLSYSVLIYNGSSIMLRIGENSTFWHVTGGYVNLSPYAHYIMRFKATADTVSGELLDMANNILGSVRYVDKRYNYYNIGFDHYGDGNGSSTMYVDWFRVRHYVYPEPTYRIEPEETI